MTTKVFIWRARPGQSCTIGAGHNTSLYCWFWYFYKVPDKCNSCTEKASIFCNKKCHQKCTVIYLNWRQVRLEFRLNLPPFIILINQIDVGRGNLNQIFHFPIKDQLYPGLSLVKLKFHHPSDHQSPSAVAALALKSFITQNIEILILNFWYWTIDVRDRRLVNREMNLDETGERPRPLCQIHLFSCWSLSLAVTDCRHHL